ncbi:MAG: monovalent cation/H(+) antiporter subunit G [Chloroflexi bacterium]|nr:monovalent cation/H(+) antiporter subunit G [Chloroflexota bacterium]
MIEILTSVLVLLGVFFVFAGSIGLVRFPDVYCRLHALGLATSLGVPAVLLASVVFFTGVSAGPSLKGLLAIVVVFLTAAVGTHIVGWSAYRSGVPLWQGSTVEQIEAPATVAHVLQRLADPSTAQESTSAVDEG